MIKLTNVFIELSYENKNLDVIQMGFVHSESKYDFRYPFTDNKATFDAFEEDYNSSYDFMMTPSYTKL